MVFVDRQSKYPNRWTLKKSDGSSEVVTLIRNDEPTVEGTPMNAATLNELSTVAGALNAKEAAAASAAEALASQKAAKTSETNAYNSEFAAKNSATAAASSQSAAKTSETNSASSATAAANSATAAASSQKAASSSEANASTSAKAAASSQTAAKTSETNAAFSATNAANSATESANSASAAKTSETNALASQTAAKTSETNAKTYLDKIQEITEGAQGWFETDTELKSKLPNGSNGWWAIVGSTDTIWLWDGDTSKWVNTATNIDAYTKAQTQENFLQRFGNVSGMDADNATVEGIYHYGGQCKNFYADEDTNIYGRLLVFNSKRNGTSGESQTWIWQIALATYPKQIWWRNRVNTEDWGTWRRITDHVDYDTLNATLASHTTSIGALNTTVGKLCDTETKTYKWNATVKGATWSRLCLVACQSGIVGSSFLLNVAGTRNSVLYNETFSINVNHSGNATIAKIGTARYSSVQLRCTVDTSGNAYVELYDDAKSATNSTTQSVFCRLVALRCGSITTYTTFTDGATMASGYSLGGIIQTDDYALQSQNGISYAAAAGNANSVNNYKVEVSATDLTAGTSALDTNKLYFVYV